MTGIISYIEGFEDEKLFGRLQELLDKLLSESGRSGYDMTVVICGDSFIHGLNKTYRSIDKPTDVLSFSQLEGESLSEPEGENPMLGDVVISLDRARSQSDEYGVTLEEELARLCVHGALHLLGMDHERGPLEEKAMFEKQDLWVERFTRS